MSGHITFRLPPYEWVMAHLTRTAWSERARCAYTDDPDLWFPPKYTGEDNLCQIDDARLECARCPVRWECLASALDVEGTSAAQSRAGVKGGFTPSERASYRDALRVDRCDSKSAGSVPGYARHMRKKELACVACRDAKAVGRAKRSEVGKSV